MRTLIIERLVVKMKKVLSGLNDFELRLQLSELSDEALLKKFELYCRR